MSEADKMFEELEFEMYWTDGEYELYEHYLKETCFTFDYNLKTLYTKGSHITPNEIKALYMRTKELGWIK